MAKNLWDGSKKDFANHIDPEREEQLKWIKIEIESRVKWILKLAKGINQGSKDGNQTTKSELVHLVEDFQKQYESLYSLYEDLREEVKKKVNEGDYDSSESTADSESYYSPEESNSKYSEISSKSPQVRDGDDQERETSDLEDTILKDKLTSTSEVKETVLSSSDSSSSSKYLHTKETPKDLGIKNDESESPKQISTDSSVFLKEKLVEREELLSLVKELQGKAKKWKHRSENLSTEKRALKEEIVYKSNEAKELRERNSKLETQVLELEATFREKESQFSEVRKKFEEYKKLYLSRIEGLEAQVNSQQLKIQTSHSQNGVQDDHLSSEATNGFSQIKSLMERASALHQELKCMRTQNDKLELEHEMRSKETSDCLVKIENLNDRLINQSSNEHRTLEEKGDLQVHVTDLELKFHSLSSQKSDMEEQITGISQEANQSKTEKEELNVKLFKLQQVLSNREKELSMEKCKLKDLQNAVSTQVASFTKQVRDLEKKLHPLQSEKDRLQLESKALQNEKKRIQMELERENSEKEKIIIELNNKLSDQQRIQKELEAVMSKLKKESSLKTNLHIVEKKVEEMAQDLRKQFEDNLRILSQRIRITEQLHMENKDWYRKKKENFKQENQDASDTAKHMLNSLDTVALKFEECHANFLNRISKVSCELKFAKDWAMRKNKALLLVRDDSDCLLSQLDDKEAEILAFRERLWKSEYQVREVEKMLKEKEETMIGLQEQKREAIRQLCVWIDYHRSRSDYYKKILSEITTPCRRTAS